MEPADSSADLVEPEVFLSQYRLEQHLGLSRVAYREAAWAAPPAPEHSIHNQILDNTPNPFVGATATVVTSEVKMEGVPCTKCVKPFKKSGQRRPIECCQCADWWCFACAGLALTPRGGSWMCPRCKP